MGSRPRMKVDNMDILNRIDSPEDLRRLDEADLEPLCAEIRDYMISCCSTNPGHLGASLGTVELSVALHYVFNTPSDKLIWDVGHQAYTHKILTGRREAFLKNRKYGGISGFPKMSESPYDAFGVGHSSTSISAALGYAEAVKLAGTHEKIVAVIGDGALTGGLAYEGLNNAGASKADLLVILNDNGISIDKNVGAMHEYLLKVSTSKSYNDLKNHMWGILGKGRFRKFVQNITYSAKQGLYRNGSLFEAMGFRYFGTVDGNNVHQLVQILGKLKGIRGPKLLHIVTKKGKGYRPAEENQVVWHAPGIFDKESGKTVSKSGGKSRYQDVFGTTLLELARKDSRIIGITPAMPSGSSMNIMMKELPERVFDVGIAEQHAVTFSAGLAAKGMLPVCNIYSSFMQRAYDSVIHDVAVQNLKVVFCLDRAGLVGEDGATHHGVFDLAAFRPVPNLAIASPLNEVDLRNMLYSAALDKNPTTVIRYPRGEGEGLEWKNRDFEEIVYGKAVRLSEGSSVACLSLGPVGNRVAKAVSRMAVAHPGMSVEHYDMRFLKPVDEEVLEYVTANFRTIVTVEDGAVKGGLFGEVSEYVASRGLAVKVVPLGIPDRFIEQGTIQELSHECGYDEASIADVLIKYAEDENIK